jgi:hypothetical protein
VFCQLCDYQVEDGADKAQPPLNGTKIVVLLIVVGNLVMKIAIAICAAAQSVVFVNDAQQVCGHCKYCIDEREEENVKGQGFYLKEKQDNA